MKRYDFIDVIPEHGSQYDVHVVENSDGEFVDADIAQEMYDALKESRTVVQCLINDGYMGYILLRTRIDEALAKADKGDLK